MPRLYVQVGVILNSQSKWEPKRIDLDDGRSYQIDKVIEVQEVLSKKPGGVSGRCFIVSIKGKAKYLYQEGSRWYVEAK